MMLALLLAQLVLPWPGRDSPLVQPGPTICVGACAGPVIYGAAERGRLVVACDMRSNTCSDGRQITTTRSTPVPCEVSPGVWEMVGVDEGCYGVRGLESWASTTSYLSYGGELDRSPWGSRNVESVQRMDGFTRVCTYDSNGGRYQISSLEPVEGEWHTLACIARANTQDQIRLQNGDGIGAFFPLGAEWSLVSRTSQMPADASAQVSVYIRYAGCIDVKACWLTKTDTPGRACWGGEAPVTCAADRHTISTEGWPTESGEISVTFRAGPPTSGDNAIIESRDGGTILFSLRRRASDGRISLITSGPTLDGASVEVGDTAHVRVVRDGSTVSLWVNGVKSAESGGMPAWVWSSTATLGRNPAGPSLPLNGSIRSLRIRSYEEVSP